MSALVAPTCRRCLLRAARSKRSIGIQNSPSLPAAATTRSRKFHAQERNAASSNTERKFRDAQEPSTRQNFRIRRTGGESRDPHSKRTIPSSRSQHTSRREFEDTLNRELESKTLQEELLESPLGIEYQKKFKRESQRDGGSHSTTPQSRKSSFQEIWNTFARTLRPSKDEESPWQDLQRSFHNGFGKRSLNLRIKYHFCRFVLGDDDKSQKGGTDLRYPAEWYPRSRTMQRQIHIHVGPTNSGKTYRALQRLEQAKNGIYAGPLRLLAHEVYSRLNAKGHSCMLLTGEERRGPPSSEEDDARMVPDLDTPLVSCTVEMVPVSKSVEVAVIDEIQMIGNHDRGWAWTSALLGIQASEIHLCGEERAVPLIRALCASVGDRVHVHKYERLSPLKVADQSLRGDLSKLAKGDCVVSFSVMGIHALRRQIEQATGKKVATVYGSLPPETRAQQARLFNEPDNDYDFLVASDAVGMGLNLAIKRMIFETTAKFDGREYHVLPISDVKQIAGRAGRFRVAGQESGASTATQDTASADTASIETVSTEASPVPANLIATFLPETTQVLEATGIVTTLEPFDLTIVRKAMEGTAEPIQKAGILATPGIIERFSTYFPLGTPLTYIFTRLYETCKTNTRFFVCGLKDQLGILDAIDSVRELSIADRITFAAAPFNTREPIFQKLLPALARCVAEQKGGSILEIPAMPLEILDEEVSPDRRYLHALESLHKGVTTYLWLSYRFHGVFRTRPLAFHIKSLVEARIQAVLNTLSFSEDTRRKLIERRQRLVEKEQVLFEDFKLVSRLPDGKGSDQGGLDNETHAVNDDESDGSDEIALAPLDEPAADAALISGEQDIPFEDPETARYLEEEEQAQPSHGEEQANFGEQRQPVASQTPPNVPPKHLSDLDFSNAETKQDIISRP